MVEGLEDHRVLSLRLIQSYGATTTIFGYLEQRQILLMQQTNKWFYSKGVGRVQTRIPLKTSLILFAFAPGFYGAHLTLQQ